MSIITPPLFGRTRSAKPKRLKLWGGAVALAVLLVATLALSGSGGVRAQHPDGTFADPQPCGPALPDANYPQDPPADYRSGHLFLFDGYWAHDAESLNNNLCPPALVTTTHDDGLGNVTETTADGSSGIDVRYTDIHITNDYQVTVVDSRVAGKGPSAYQGTTIDKAEYRFLEDVQPGDKVWWLRLDDPDTTDVDETSDLQLSFSALRLSSDYWHRTDSTASPIQFHYNAERHEIAPADAVHFYAFEAPKAGNAHQDDAIWDSTEAEVTPMDVRPSQRRSVQWVITGAGTHRLGVHMQGYVRQVAPTDWDAATNGAWQRLTHGSHNRVVTSEVVYYTLQVGSLTRNQEAMFVLERSVLENSAAGTPVGDPIPVANPDSDTLTFSLSGRGHELFTVAATADGQGAQVSVAAGANLDYETTPSYDLILALSDNKDRESNPDPTIDHTIALRVNLADEGPTVIIHADNTRLGLNESVHLSVTTREFPTSGSLTYQWEAHTPGDSFQSFPGNGTETTLTYFSAQAATQTYRVRVVYDPGGGAFLWSPIYSQEVTVTWSNSN